MKSSAKPIKTKKIDKEILAWIKYWAAHGPTYFQDNPQERKEILEKTLIDLEEKFGLFNEIIKIMACVENDFCETLAANTKQKEEFEKRTAWALQGFEAILNLTKDLYCGENIGALLLSKEEEQTLSGIQKRLIKRINNVKDKLKLRAAHLRSPQSRKRKIFQFILPYQAWIYKRLEKKTPLNASSRAEIVSNLFYGFGLTKNHDTVDSLFKTVNKAKPPRSYFHFYRSKKS